MTVSDIADRLLAYAGLEQTSTPLPVGTTAFLADAIGGGMSEIVKKARRFFDRPVGAVLGPKRSGTVTSAASFAATITGSSGFLKLQCTLRIPTAEADATVITLSGGTNATIAPGWAVANGTASPATLWDDAFPVTNILILDEATTVQADGKPLTRVNSRERALELIGRDADGRSRECGAREFPEVWWPERDQGTGVYVRVYPMPVIATELQIHGTRIIPEITAGNVLNNSTNFFLEEHVARDIWLPLATLRWANCPLMANSPSREEIVRQAREAEASLAQLVPKREKPRPWNDRIPVKRGW